MNSENKIFKKNQKNGQDKNNEKIIFIYKKIFYKCISLFIIFIYFLFNFIKVKINNIKKKQEIDDIINFTEKDCDFIKDKLKNRTKPFDYEKELIFFISLISCKIPFSFIRFGDGEESIMSGKIIDGGDKWHWDQNNTKFQDSLIKASSICLESNNFITIPCKNWITYSKSILSFSKCTSAKYMSYTTLFVNKNFQSFRYWFLRFIKYSSRWKIILIANFDINMKISWAYKFFPIPNHIVENWDELSSTLLPKLSDEARKNELIFFVSAGPGANIIISYLIKINNKNIYIDLGSSLEIFTKGYSTRYYIDKKGKESNKRCEAFYLKDKKLFYEN